MAKPWIKPKPDHWSRHVADLPGLIRRMAELQRRRDAKARAALSKGADDDQAP